MAAPAYNYATLAEAAAAHGVYNIWAVVAECTVPRPTRGTDMVCNLTLVDPSTAQHPELAAGVEMLCFAARSEDMPHVRRARGDIIRLHRVKMGSFNDRPQLVGKVGYRGGGFAFCLFDGAPGGGGTPSAGPYQSSAEHYHFDPREAQLLAALRHYLETANRQQLGGNTTYLRRIMDVRPREFFDVVARVVALDDSLPDFRLLHIWDSTDALPFPFTYDTRRDEDQPEAQRIHQLLRPFALPLKDMVDRSGIPLLGTTLPLVFPKSARVEQPAVGSWVKFRNIGARVVSGQLQAYFLRNSRWTPWQPDQQTAALEAEYQQRLEGNHTAGWAPDPELSPGELLALSRHRDRPITTLRQVLLDTAAGQPRCYRVLVRLMAYSPQHPADMCHPAAACGLPDLGGGGGWVYTLKLLVEDATAQLDAKLFGSDGDTFFTGLPACDMRANAAAADQLTRRLQELQGLGCQRDGGPWMELTVKSYFMDPQRPWETRQYRVYDASLRPPAAS